MATRLTQTEDQLQKAVARYLDALGLLWCHVPNEGKRNPVAGNIARQKGLKSGVPDCLIFDTTGQYKGLAIELKVGYRKPTENQLHWKAKLISRGWAWEVAYDLDQVINLIRTYYGK